jgi:hypothetical protein
MAEGKRTIRLGKEVLAITEPVPVQGVVVDAVVEAREYNGVLCISLASICQDGDAAPEARVCARLRIPIPAAMILNAALQDMLKQAMPGKEGSN